MSKKANIITFLSRGFGLVNYRDYHRRSTGGNAKLLSEYPERQGDQL